MDETMERMARSSPRSHRESGDWRSIGETGIADHYAPRAGFALRAKVSGCSGPAYDAIEHSADHWTIRPRIWAVMSGQYVPYHILINLDIEDEGDLVGNALVAETRVSAFHLEDC